uniref:Uncharacterized protein n=1 Tax=Cacopsylla melanoneura TaxID=428564 RepID=A0A8D8RWJ2_9HEMI
MQVLEISYFSFKRMKNPNTIYSIFSHADVKNSWIKCRPCFYSSFITVGIKNGKNHFSHFYFSFPGEEKVAGEIFWKTMEWEFFSIPLWFRRTIRTILDIALTRRVP